MFNIKVLNYKNAFDYVYNNSYLLNQNNNKYAIISIQDGPNNEMGFIYKKGGNCLGALNLWFSDVTEMGYKEALKHNNYNYLKLISDEDCLKIRVFIEEISKLDIDTLIIHCRAGQSRSAGVAAALSQVLFGNDYEYFNSPRYTVNMTVYYKVLKAFGYDMRPSFEGL